MKITRAMLFGAAAIVAVGCYANPDKETVAPTLQVAYTRYVNAVNDTGPLDIHFVDEINNSPIGLAVPYRGFTFYQPTDPTFQGKARVLRAFYDSINVAQAITTQTQQVGADLSMSFTAGDYYTIILLGPSKGAAPKWVVIQDNATAFDTTWASVVGDTTHIAARVVNLTAADGTGESVSLFMAKDSLFTTDNAAFPGVAAPASAMTATGTDAYAKISLGGVGGATGTTFDTSIVKYARVTGVTVANNADVTNAGLATGSYFTAVPIGAAADQIDDLTAIGGLIQGGTVISAYVFAPVTPGSIAPCAGAIVGGAAPGCTKTTTPQFRNYSVVFVVDHHPTPSF